MDYRMKYRDVPWSVALGCLLGKILFTLTFKWMIWVEKNWRRILWKIGKLSFIVFIILLIATMALLLANKLTDGTLFMYFDHLLGTEFLSSTFNPPVETPPEL